jgi:hypothetical protein
MCIPEGENGAFGNILILKRESFSHFTLIVAPTDEV